MCKVRGCVDSLYITLVINTIVIIIITTTIDADEMENL
jgi:hypothetical protein